MILLFVVKYQYMSVQRAVLSMYVSVQCCETLYWIWTCTVLWRSRCWSLAEPITEEGAHGTWQQQVSSSRSVHIWLRFDVSAHLRQS